MFRLGKSGAVSWKSSFQKTAATSSTQAEYQALSEAVCEGLWLRKLLIELGFVQANGTTIWQDNLGATTLAKNQVHFDRAKHYDVAYHFCGNHVH